LDHGSKHTVVTHSLSSVFFSLALALSAVANNATAAGTATRPNEHTHTSQLYVLAIFKLWCAWIIFSTPINI